MNKHVDLAIMMSSAEPAIAIRDLEKSYGAFKAVADANIIVPQGAFLVLVGPSGCGKSTMLKMLAGLEAPSGGSLSFLGREVANGHRGVILDPSKRDCGLVFQSYALWPHMTVAGNVEWPLKVAKMPAAERAQRVQEVLKLLGIQHLAARYPNEISGGQQQRVAIARMIAPRPGILLFDEPLSNLDARLRVEMRTELLRVHRATGATSVYVTHDQVEALTMASHVAVMKDGRIEQFGAPHELISHPRTAFVATFMGTPPANLIPAIALDGEWQFAGVRLAPADGPSEAQLMYRAETLLVGEAGARRALQAEALESVPVAGRTMITALCQNVRLTAVVDGTHRLAIGEPISITCPAAPEAVFTMSGVRL